MHRVEFDNGEMYFTGTEIRERESDGFILVLLDDECAKYLNQKIYCDPDYLSDCNALTS